MKKLITIIALSALAAGCTLTGVRNGNVQKRDAAPVEHTDEHLGDPTFTRETVDAETEPDATDNAVVGDDESTPRSVAPTAFDKGMKLFEKGELRKARTALTAALDAELGDDEARALKTLRQINDEIFLKAGTDGDLSTYTVKGGDTLAKIAKAKGGTWEFLQRINGMEDTRLNVGDELLILKGSFELVVRKSKFVMDLMLNGDFIQRYDVGLGKDGCTPVGEFVIKNRIPKPADGSYPHGHPKHRLGSHWLGLRNDAGYKGYGIHGSRADLEHEIGTECSEGCVRLTNKDVTEIFDIVPVGTRVVIKE